MKGIATSYLVSDCACRTASGANCSGGTSSDFRKRNNLPATGGKGVNDHYHRPKQEIVQKVIEAIGENPKECTSQGALRVKSDRLMRRPRAGKVGC